MSSKKARDRTGPWKRVAKRFISLRQSHHFTIRRHSNVSVSSRAPNDNRGSQIPSPFHSIKVRISIGGRLGTLSPVSNVMPLGSLGDQREIVDVSWTMLVTSRFNRVWARMAKSPLELAVQAVKPFGSRSSFKERRKSECH